MDVKAIGAAAYRPMVAMVLLVGLAACASSPKKTVAVPFETVMANAEAQVVTAGADTSIKAFEDAAKADPTRKEPWVRIAQLQFDQGNYARAIVAAEEVLQRDPDDLVADGVLTVAGFRVANQSLQRLQGRGALASETARKEAQTLADTLRATMGDAVLIAEKPKPRARSSARTTARRAGPAPAAAQPAAQPAARQTRSDNSDPFQNIGN
ncbi:tetratricopeptide repeat protein [Stenotrophomonas sp. SY1]|uniref:tetratricopeptide repeat protein n=1 Tax=Stenotrophomonas sp. SY1 TaxID=477235 RepID=UPI001E553217|nr:tetratricopeptide repeat protein [Stenotrophomonas sp. SY1]MCD9087040.1 tetratricopeptide repeat protein [Stenotrophomonas sp. SY1]